MGSIQRGSKDDNTKISIASIVHVYNKVMGGK